MVATPMHRSSFFFLVVPTLKSLGRDNQNSRDLVKVGSVTNGFGIRNLLNGMDDILPPD